MTPTTIYGSGPEDEKSERRFLLLWTPIAAAKTDFKTLNKCKINPLSHKIGLKGGLKECEKQGNKHMA